MLSDRVSNPGPLTCETGALPIALRGPAVLRYTIYEMFSIEKVKTEVPEVYQVCRLICIVAYKLLKSTALKMAKNRPKLYGVLTVLSALGLRSLFT